MGLYEMSRAEEVKTLGSPRGKAVLTITARLRRNYAGVRERGPVEDSIPPTAGITSPIDAQPDALLT